MGEARVPETFMPDLAFEKRITTLRGGYYGLYQAPEFDTELASIGACSALVLDLIKTEHLECVCIGILMKYVSGWKKHYPEFQVELVNVNQNLTRMLKIIRLDEVFIL